MNRSSSTPPTFIATPWMPAGRPNRNSCRMIAKSGFHDMPRLKCTTRRPVRIIQSAAADTVLLAITVPSAAPRVPMAGIGPGAGNQHDVEDRRSARVMTTPSRSGVRASPAARSAPPSMKNSSMPML